MARRTYKINHSGVRSKRRTYGSLLFGFVCLICLLTVVLLAFSSVKKAVSFVGYLSRRAITTEPTAQTVNYGLPVRLKISKIAIDAPITYMGITKQGAMAVPGNIVDVGWYKNGALPGNTGSAVLAGHIDGLRGQPAVFANLKKLQKGDTLQIIDNNHAVINFTVRESRTYSPGEQPSEVFHASDAAHLNLITCTGAWDKTQHQFLGRLVVFTDKSSL